MIDGIKLNTDGISPNQRRLRLKELSGVPLTEDEIKRLKPRTTLLNEVVSMVQPTKYHDRIVTSPSPKKEPNEDEDEIDDEEIDEIIKELFEHEDYSHWGYEDDNEIDVGDMSEKKLRNLIYQILTNREDWEDEESVEELFEGVLNVGTLQFSSSLSNKNTLVFIPKSSKMLDVIENMSDSEVINKIITVLKKKYKGINFIPSYSYDGFGYGVDIDFYSFV